VATGARLSAGERVKRLVIGRPLPTERLAHERLGKPTALAVFASDNLSSSAYATEEILRVLLLAGGIGALAFGLLVPITIALLVVLGILLFSYRQTIKAYPQAGGAYLVTRDNFGMVPALVAGVALLTDYILTVSVSVSAGTAALTSTSTMLFAWRVPISVGFVALIALGNLRGVKESGRIFAAPTFFFIAMMGVLLGTSFYRLLTGGVHPVHTFSLPASHLKNATIFLVLHAFASGGAAVTGVEAISNGVPAFKPPEWRNARTTLMWMGGLLGAMFLGLSIMAARLHVMPDPGEKVTVLAQVASATFGRSPTGRVLFFMLQIGTLLILVLAANTSFADFPRLASFLAGDRFLPGQLTQFGDRLVFSNGIIALSVAASVLVVAFKASVTRLIPLYAIGVFTSFTLSQAGMAVRHIRRREQGWRIGLAINGAGAVVTAVVAVIIAGTKFMDGAWIILVAIPVVIAILLRIYRHYGEVALLLRDPARRPPPVTAGQRAVIAMDRPGPDDRLAAGYAARLAPAEIRVVHVGSTDQALIGEWARMGVSDTIEILPQRTASVASDLRLYVRRLRREVGAQEVLNVVVPEEVDQSSGALYLIRRAKAQFIKAALLAEPDIVITNVTAHGGFEVPDPRDTASWRHVAIVLVSGVHNASLKALAYARSLHPDALQCVHIEVEKRATSRVVTDWEAWAPGASLEVVESPYRDVSGPVVERVRHLLADVPNTFVTIVLPEFVVKRWWHHALHNQTALLLKRAFLFEPSVAAVASVPYKLWPDASGSKR
jgi:amino acid transporter